jgi:hypothetical protein
VRATGKSEAQHVHEALAAFLQGPENGESCLDLARRHQLIGRAKDLPADLSTNQEHFEGFGK